MSDEIFIDTIRGYYNISDKIKDGYKLLDEYRLLNPKPMILNQYDLRWVKENLGVFVQENYSFVSKKVISELHSIGLEKIKERPYIFTCFFNTFDEDVYLLKLKIENQIINIYMIKYSEMEGIYNNGEIINHELLFKIRLENEDWYRNLFYDDNDYLKNRY